MTQARRKFESQPSSSTSSMRFYEPFPSQGARCSTFSLVLWIVLGLATVGVWPAMPLPGQIIPPNAPGLDAELAPARAALASQQWAEADRLLRQYLLQHRSSVPALYLLAETLFHEDKPKDSLGIFTQAAQEAPPSALDLRYVALDYVLLDDYDDADKWITRSARENSTDAETWYVMGRIKYTENRFREAVDSFLKSLEYHPQSVKAENNLGLAHEGLNEPELAIGNYRQALAWERTNPHPSEQPALNLGALLTDRNQFDEALTLLQQAEGLAPKDGKIHAALGKLYARRGELPLAQAELLQAVAAQPNDAGLHFQLGQVYRKQGQKEQAAAELGQAAALQSSSRNSGK